MSAPRSILKAKRPAGPHPDDARPRKGPRISFHDRASDPDIATTTHQTTTTKRSLKRKAPPPPPPPPKRLRRVQLKLSDLECIRTLGEGTFGKTLLVRKHGPKPGEDTHIRRAPVMFALKVTKKALLETGKSHSLKTERKFLAELPWSPWISGLVDTFTDPLNHYLLLEYSPCGTLHELLRMRGALHETSVHFYAVNILCAIDFLHDHRIVHADIKPDNILVGPDGYLTLCDFGGAKDLNEAQRDLWLQYPGNLYYLAPELFGFGTAATPSYTVDFWALGVLIYEMAFGAVPFTGACDTDVYASILAGVRWPAASTAYAMRHAAASLLHVEPKRRLGYIDHAREVFGHDWFAGRGVRTFRIRQRHASAPEVRPREDVVRTWHTRPLPRAAEVPGLRLVRPAADVRYDKRWKRSAADGPHIPFEPSEDSEEAV